MGDALRPMLEYLNANDERVALILWKARQISVHEPAWTGLHRDWPPPRGVDDAVSELTYGDMLHAHDSMLAQREWLERARRTG
jgi:hypothetical protein